MEMPSVNMGKIRSAEAKKIAERIVRPDGTLRASKPATKDELGKKAAYVWRMVAFYVSPNPRHQCWPVCAVSDLPGADWREKNDLAKNLLDTVVQEIVDAVPKEEWHGIIRWGEAWGAIGTPRIAPDGSIIYRL